MEKEDMITVSYTLGIISIVLAFFNSPAGLILGIIGFVKSKKSKTELAIRAKKLNTIGIILSAILFVVSIIVSVLVGLNTINQIF